MTSGVAVYLVPALALLLMALRIRRTTQAENANTLEDSRKAGLTEPASLHPVIDGARCIGCGSCAAACPEGNVLGVISGKAELVNPASCIGHGACKDACPIDAITLVFGTETRGVDIPRVDSGFETDVRGIFIAGELGGMGLIRNAVTQGVQALDSIRKRERLQGDWLDVVIVGAGPAGFSASLGALEHGLRYVTIEQESLGGTVAHYPRGKIIMTAPVKLPLVGKVRFTETSKEHLLKFWQEAEARTGVKINYRERVEKIEPLEHGYLVRTSKGTYRAGAVLLAIGRRGTPRKLGVPGEELPKVVYRLIDPEQYRGQHVLVVGGGDSALEAAASIAGEEGSVVTLSYRSAAFSRAKEKNRRRIEDAERRGTIRILFKSNVSAIHPGSVDLDQEGDSLTVRNDSVIVSAGGILPTAFLKEVGIHVETKYGKA